MRILIAAPEGEKPLARQVPARVRVPAAEPLRFRIEGAGAQGVLRAAFRMPSREWERKQVEMQGRQRIEGPAAIEFFATGVAPGRHRIHFDVTLETHEGGLVRETTVAGDLVLEAE